MTGWQPTTPLAHAVFHAGFVYDGRQDILVSRMDAPLQRITGFCWAYDWLSPALLMILDCECFYFSYGGKSWLIELWKGQYGIETGCEIGVYNRHGVGRLGDRGTLFKCAEYHEMPTMWFRLLKDGKPFIERGPEPHWWLTGFRWGVFTHSHQLTMDIRITFDNKPDMCTAFKQALKAKGYAFSEIGPTGVAFLFNRPVEQQPPTRWAAAPAAQAANERLVARYIELRDGRGLSSNNPNGFAPPEQWVDKASHAAREIADKAAKLHDQASAAANKAKTRLSTAANAAHNEALAAAKRRQEQAAAAAKKLKAGVSSVANGIEGKLSEAKSAYGDITAFFEGMALRTAPSRRG